LKEKKKVIIVNGKVRETRDRESGEHNWLEGHQKRWWQGYTPSESEEPKHSCWHFQTP